MEDLRHTRRILRETADLSVDAASHLLPRHGLPLPTVLVHAAHLADGAERLAQVRLVGATHVLFRACLETLVNARFMAVHPSPTQQLLDLAVVRAQWRNRKAALWLHPSAEALGPRPVDGLPSLLAKLSAFDQVDPEAAEWFRMALHFLYDDASEMTHGSVFGALGHAVAIVDPDEACAALQPACGLVAFCFLALLDSLGTAGEFGEARPSIQREVRRLRRLLTTRFRSPTGTDARPACPKPPVSATGAPSN